MAATRLSAAEATWCLVASAGQTGAPRKVRDGRTPFANLVLIGTDQGYLGITGAMLSGIMMANEHVLRAR